MLPSIRPQSKNDKVENDQEKLRGVLFYIGDSVLVLATKGKLELVQVTYL